MILNSIEIENIRSYGVAKIDFPRGITLFEGDIGSGKSTVLMGIEFALFGLGSQKAESLLSKKASTGSVILEFEVAGKRYIVKRKLRRKGDTVSQDAKDSYLISDGQTEPLSPAELKQRVLQILKFNEPSDPRSESRIFRYAVFTPQEEMKQILKDVQKRLETIRKAFGVEDYRIVTENAKAVSQAIKERMVEFKVRFENLAPDEASLDDAHKNAKRIDSIIVKLLSDKSKLDEKRLTLKKELELLTAQLKRKQQMEFEQEKIQSKIKDKESLLSNFQSQILRQQKEIPIIEQKINTLAKIVQPTIKPLHDLDLMISRLSGIRDKIRDKKSEFASLDDDLVKLKKQLGEFFKLPEGERDKIEKELAEIRSKIKENKKNKAALEVHGIELEKEKKDTKKLLAELQGLGAKCPYCENTLTAEHKLKIQTDRESKLRDVELKLVQINADLESISTTVEKLERDEMQKDDRLRQIDRVTLLQEQWSEKSHKKSVLELEIPKLESEFNIDADPSFLIQKNEDPLSYLRRLKDAQKEYENSKQKLSELRSQKQDFLQAVSESQTQLEEQKKVISQLEKELESILGQTNEFLGLDKVLSEKEQEQSDLDKVMSEFSESLTQNKYALENEKSRIGELEKKILDARKWKEKHHKFSNYYDWLREFFIPTVDKIEKQVLLSIQQKFNETYRKWYSVLIDDSTKESRINEEFTPIVEQDGYDQDVDFLSGGEKTSIALAYRLTLNSMMRQESEGLQSNLLILDEPTDGFSKAQLSKVRNLLEELKSQQIILVSHEKELETYVDNIFQITKESGVSKVMRLSNY